METRSEMSPTAELRFVMRPVHIDSQLVATVNALQQKWVQHHIPAGQTSASFEWRDVPLVVEVPNG